MVNSVGDVSASISTETFVANGLNPLSGAHAGQYELAFNGGPIQTSGTIGTTTPPPVDFSTSMIFVALDTVALGAYFVEGSHQRLAYFRGDGGGSYEGLAFQIANKPQTDPAYDPSTLKTVYMPAGWTLV
jgi:hypothetical protein